MSNLAINLFDTLALNLQRLMDLNKISEAELSRQSGLPQPTIHKVLKGKTSDPRSSTLKALADFFGITIDELISGRNLDKNFSSSHAVPIISWIESINAPEFVSQLTPSIWPKWVVTEPLPKNCFALISKPSMEPRFPVGTALIIDPTITAEDGDIVLIHYPNTLEATLREISIDGPDVQLFNLYGKDYCEPLRNELTIKGIVVRSIFYYHE